MPTKSGSGKKERKCEGSGARSTVKKRPEMHIGRRGNREPGGGGGARIGTREDRGTSTGKGYPGIHATISVHGQFILIHFLDSFGRSRREPQLTSH